MEMLSLIRINKTIYDKMKKKTLSYGEYEAVTNGLLRIVRNEGITLPKKATNGDIIKALFDCEVFDPIDDIVPVIFSDNKKALDGFFKEWWNSPYRGINDKRGEI